MSLAAATKRLISKSFLLLFFKKEDFFFEKKQQKTFAYKDSGFTLLEILVAVVVLGFVLAGLGQATHFGISAWNVQARLAARSADMERVDRILRLLFTEAVAPLAADDKPFAGQEHRLLFVTRLPDQPQTQPVRRAQVGIGVDAQHRLVLNWQPHANAIALTTLPPPAQIVLESGVDHIDMMYCQSVDDGGKWLHVWQDSSLPALVQIHIVMQDKHQDWPVLQVATMLDTNGSF